MIEILSDKQTKLLLALAKYKFLTISQFKRLGIDKHDSNLRKALKPLLESKRKFLDRIQFSMYPKENDLTKRSKLEYVYYLKAKGKKVIVENQLIEEELVRMPIGTASFAYKDYFHRKETINCQIALEQSAIKQGSKILFFDTYFDKIGNNRNGKNLRAKTRINISGQHYLIADAIFMLENNDQKHLYCLELQNGRDTGLLLKKLKGQYVRALHLGSPSEKYGFEKGNRVLVILEYKSLLNAILRQLQLDYTFKHLQAHFLFKSLDKVDDFYSNWFLMNGAIVNLF